MKIENLIDKSDKTKYNLFMLTQIDKDKKEIESLLKCLGKCEAELEQIKIDSQACIDVRELSVIEAHYDNVMNEIYQYSSQYGKLIARCERREKNTKRTERMVKNE